MIKTQTLSFGGYKDVTKELRISQQTGCAPTIKIQMWNTTRILSSMQISEEEARELKKVLEKAGY